MASSSIQGISVALCLGSIWLGWVATPTLAGQDPAATVRAVDPRCFADCDGGLAGELDVGPRLGERAPDFAASLVYAFGGEAVEVALHDLLGERPVILAFGSYT